VVTTTAALHVGDTVWVDWGLTEVRGVVRSLYGTGRARRVVVDVPIPGSTGEQLDTESVTLPLSAVRLG
jgi:hypothetical protein